MDIYLAKALARCESLLSFDVYCTDSPAVDFTVSVIFKNSISDLQSESLETLDKKIKHYRSFQGFLKDYKKIIEQDDGTSIYYPINMIYRKNFVK